MDDDSTSRLLRSAYSLKELDIVHFRVRGTLSRSVTVRLSFRKEDYHPVELPSCNRDRPLWSL